MSDLAVAYLAAWEKCERVRNYDKVRHEGKSNAHRDTMLLLLRDMPESKYLMPRDLHLLGVVMQYIKAAAKTPDIPGYKVDNNGVCRRLKELYERADQHRRAEDESNTETTPESAASPVEPTPEFCDTLSLAAYQLITAPNSPGHKFREARNSAAMAVPSEFSLPTGQAKPASSHSPSADGTTTKVAERVGTGKNARKRQLRKAATAAMRIRGFAANTIVHPDVPY